MVDQPLTPRVLVVTASFPPDAAVGTLRTLRLIRHATDSDWSVDVLTIAAETYRQGTVTDAGMLSKVPEGVRVIRARALRPAERLLARLRGRREARGPMNAASSATAENRPRTATWNGGVIRKVKEAGSAMLALPDREVSWLLPAVIRACQATRGARPDVIYSSGPPFTAHLVAAVLSVVFRRPWVADFRDPWARAPWREDRFGFERQAWGLFERLVVSRAHTTVFVTRTNAREFAAHYGEKIARRFRVVANGCDPSDFEGLRGRADGNRFVLLHAGSLYGARNPAPLFRAVAAAIARGSIAPDRLRIRFIGRLGISGFAMTALLRDLGLSAIVEFVPHMPRRDVLQEMLNASALLIVQPVTRVSVPGKLYEYLAAGRPILGLAEPDGETAEIIRNSPAGVTVCAEDPVAIEQGLLELMASSQRPVMAASRDTYDGVARAAELEELLLQAAASRGSRIPRLRQVGLATEHAAQETRRS